MQLLLLIYIFFMRKVNYLITLLSNLAPSL